MLLLTLAGGPLQGPGGASVLNLFLVAGWLFLVWRLRQAYVNEFRLGLEKRTLIVASSDLLGSEVDLTRLARELAVAHEQLEYLTRVKRIPARQIHVIHNGIDPAPYRLPEAAREAAREIVAELRGLLDELARETGTTIDASHSRIV